MLRHKLIEWFLYTVAFALLPMTIFLLVEYVFDYKGGENFKYISELFIFTIMISSGTIRELFGHKGKTGFSLALLLISILFTIISAILYGTTLLRAYSESFKQ